MVLGLLGIQSETVARFDGRLKVGVVSARLDDERKRIADQVVKEIWLEWVGKKAFSDFSPTNC
jgi:hypothetical protein